MSLRLIGGMFGGEYAYRKELPNFLARTNKAMKMIDFKTYPMEDEKGNKIDFNTYSMDNEIKGQVLELFRVYINAVNFLMTGIYYENDDFNNPSPLITKHIINMNEKIKSYFEELLSKYTNAVDKTNSLTIEQIIKKFDDNIKLINKEINNLFETVKLDAKNKTVDSSYKNIIVQYGIKELIPDDNPNNSGNKKLLSKNKKKLDSEDLYIVENKENNISFPQRPKTVNSFTQSYTNVNKLSNQNNQIDISDYNTLKENNENLINKVETLEQENKDLKQKYDKSQNDNEKIRENLKTIKLDKTDCIQKNNELNSQIDNITNENKRYEQENEKLRTNNFNKESCNKQLTDKNNKITELENKIMELTNKEKITKPEIKEVATMVEEIPAKTFIDYMKELAEEIDKTENSEQLKKQFKILYVIAGCLACKHTRFKEKCGELNIIADSCKSINANWVNNINDYYKKKDG